MAWSEAETTWESITENFFDPRVDEQLSHKCKWMYTPSDGQESEYVEDSHDNHNDNNNPDNNTTTEPEEEEPQIQPMESFRDCQCGKKSVVRAKLLVAKKIGFRDTARLGLMKDLEYLAPGTVNNMYWPQIRNFASAVRLKSSVQGVGKPELIQRIDVLRVS